MSYSWSRSVFQDGSGIVNYLRGTRDQFAEKSTGWVLTSIDAVYDTAGLAIIQRSWAWSGARCGSDRARRTADSAASHGSSTTSRSSTE